VARSGSTSHGADGIYLVARAGAAPLKVVSQIRGPLGLVWVGDSLYVSSLDGVERFGGLSGGRFTRRAPILKGPVAGAENNNLVLAPNGRLVNLGSSGGHTAAFASAALRSGSHSILGYTNNSLTPRQREEALTEVLELAASGGCAVEVEPFPLADVAEAWTRAGSNPDGRVLVLPA
jgi:hypothetical protein